jgi:hypothetical protein
MILASFSGPAWADAAGAVVQGFGLPGTWANDCGRNLDKHQAGFKMIFEVPEKGPPTRVTISSDGTHKTTVKADIMGAQPLGTTGLVIQARISGGDRDGGPLPGASLLGIDQSFEKIEPNVLYVKGRDPVRLVRCPAPPPTPANPAATTNPETPTNPGTTTKP